MTTGSPALTPSAEDLDRGSLERWLSANVPEITGTIDISKFPGGQSNPTYRLDASAGSYVLRRKPFGPILPSAHAIDREFRLISALHPAGFPVAKPYALCEDPQVIGAPFYVMSLVQGRTFWDGKLPDESPETRRAVYESMIRTLAHLHSLDHEALGLGDYAPPGNYFERQVRRWTKQYRAAQTEHIETVEKLIDFLSGSVPEQSRTSIIHGDYRIDNIVFAPDSSAIRAVLDWELSTIGDPLADFAYLAMQWEMPSEGGGAGLKGVDFTAAGIPTLEEAVALYCGLTGRDCLPDLDWYFSYNLFRLLGIVQGIRKRFLDGNASSANAEAAGLRVPMLAAAAWEFARKAGAPS
ncbi:MAG: phosphotransferase family protein [Pseudomonadota bacterium]|nr:phosphotransferase family protein [Pseudomonadota bacterium]